MIDLYKYPRLYLNASFEENAKISLDVPHVHYLKNVLRKSNGDIIRVFNGRDGEWLANIDSFSKKSGGIVLAKKIKEQPVGQVRLDLYFSPIKKYRMDFLIEKAVELGVSGLHPVITNRCENRKFNEDRVRVQIIEAAEQCERLDLPVLYTVKKLSDVFLLNKEFPIYVCLERGGKANHISSYSYKDGASFLVGSEGGFDEGEMEFMSSLDNVVPVGLGDVILRAETAVVACLSYVKLSCVR